MGRPRINATRAGKKKEENKKGKGRGPGVGQALHGHAGCMAHAAVRCESDGPGPSSPSWPRRCVRARWEKGGAAGELTGEGQGTAARSRRVGGVAERAGSSLAASLSSFPDPSNGDGAAIHGQGSAAAALSNVPGECL
jgi:hypothetical protein